jgi:hypothetical protein
VAEEAARLGAVALTLDSGVQRAAAHWFYFRERMQVMAFHFARGLQAAEPPTRW